MKIKFMRDYTTKEESPQTFKANEVYDVPEKSARRWFNRNLAVPVEEAPTVATKKKSKSNAGDK